MKEKTKLKHPNRRCNSESAKEVTIRTNDNKNALVDERGRIICAVPLVDCKHPGKPVVEGPDTAVKMKCSHNQCQLQSKPIHMDCFRTLEEKMMTILQHLPHRTSRWTTQQMRNNLWDKKGMSLIEKHMRCKCGNGVVVRDEDAWDKSQKQLHAGEEKKRRTTKKRTLPALGTRSVSECIDTNENFPASSLNFESNQPTVLKYPIGYAPIANETGNRQGKPNVSSVTEFPPLSGDSWQVAGPSRRRGVSFSTVAKASVKPLTTIVPSVAQNATAPKSSFTQNLRSKRTATLVSHSYPKTTAAGLPELLNANIIRASAMNDVSSNNNEWEWDVESDFYECERPVELGNRYRYDEADDWASVRILAIVTVGQFLILMMITVLTVVLLMAMIDTNILIITAVIMEIIVGIVILMISASEMTIAIVAVMIPLLLVTPEENMIDSTEEVHMELLEEDGVDRTMTVIFALTSAVFATNLTIRNHQMMAIVLDGRC